MNARTQAGLLPELDLGHLDALEGEAFFTLGLAQPLPLLPFEISRTGGALIVVDPSAHRTSGALLVVDPSA